MTKEVEHRKWWILSVEEYGEFPFFGTSQEAQQRLEEKIDWEGTEGQKFPASSSKEDTDLIGKFCLNYRYHQIGDNRDIGEQLAVSEWLMNHIEWMKEFWARTT